MVWYSEEIMNNYNLINKLVNNALKLRNDNVKYKSVLRLRKSLAGKLIRLIDTQSFAVTITKTVQLL